MLCRKLNAETQSRSPAPPGRWRRPPATPISSVRDVTPGGAIRPRGTIEQHRVRIFWTSRVVRRQHRDRRARRRPSRVALDGGGAARGLQDGGGQVHFKRSTTTESLGSARAHQVFFRCGSPSKACRKHGDHATPRAQAWYITTYSPAFGPEVSHHNGWSPGRWYRRGDLRYSQAGIGPGSGRLHHPYRRPLVVHGVGSSATASQIARRRSPGAVIAVPVQQPDRGTAHVGVPPACGDHCCRDRRCPDLVVQGGQGAFGEALSGCDPAGGLIDRQHGAVHLTPATVLICCGELVNTTGSTDRRSPPAA